MVRIINIVNVVFAARRSDSLSENVGRQGTVTVKKKMIVLIFVCATLLLVVGAYADNFTYETVTVVKNNNGVLPIQIKPGENVLILVQEKEIGFTETCAASFRQGWNDMVDEGLIPSSTSVRIVSFNNNDWDNANKLEAIDDADYVFVNSVVGSMADMGYKTWRTAAPKKYIDYASSMGKKAIAISMGAPGDVQLFPNAKGILAIVSNPADAIKVAFGAYGAYGKLPANIYAYDPVTDSYDTKKIVYPKEFGIEYDPITVMDNVKVLLEFSQAQFTGFEIRPKVIATVEIMRSDGKHTKTLTEGKDYSIIYSNNVNVGTATVTVSGMGSYLGTKDAHFQIIENVLPQTGDRTMPELWMTLMLTSLLIAIPLIRKSRRNVK